jgi:hypothetical protein
MVYLAGGVPWDVAETMSDNQRIAAAIIKGELDGGEFDWAAMRWRERK